MSNANTSSDAYILPPPLMIDRVSLLKNSNVLGNDVCSEDIYLFNLKKCTLECHNSQYDVLGMTLDGNGFLSSNVIPKSNTGSVNCNVELPISINRSFLVPAMIKNDLVVRVYFKSNIIYSGPNNSDIKLSNLQLYLRAKELSNDSRAYLYK